MTIAIADSIVSFGYSGSDRQELSMVSPIVTIMSIAITDSIDGSDYSRNFRRELRECQWRSPRSNGTLGKYPPE